MLIVFLFFFFADYSFPYITIILSVLSNAAHFAFKLNQTVKSLLLSSVSDIKNVIVILGHWLLHGYGVVAVATLRGISVHPAMLALVVLPALFYIITARFTDPHKLHIEWIFQTNLVYILYIFRIFKINIFKLYIYYVIKTKSCAWKQVLLIKKFFLSVIWDNVPLEKKLDFHIRCLLCVYFCYICGYWDTFLFAA